MFFSDLALDPKFASAVHPTVKLKKRAHLAGFLDENGAQRLLDATQTLDWRTVTNVGGETQDLVPKQISRLDQDKLIAQLHEEAKTQFRFMYDAFRLSDACLSGALLSGPLVEFFATMNAEPALELFRAITGDARIAYLDMIVSRYRPGHFLTAHNDAQEGGFRLYAFVFNLSPIWRADWGGLLNFYDSDGHVAEAYTPRWGALNIFEVPQWHAVTMVAPFAAAERYSITGWMRSKRATLSSDHPAARGPGKL